MDFRLDVSLDADDPGEDVAPWLTLLAEEVGDLEDVVLTSAEGTAPEGAKGLSSLVAKVPLTAVKTLISALKAWSVRTGRTVEVSLDGDTIKISGASREQQDRVVEAWLERHAARP